MVVFSVALALVLFSFSVPHLWYSVGTAGVVFTDGSAGTAKIYKSKNGEFLFSIKEQPEEIYLYVPSRKLVGIPNGDQFVFIPWFAFSKDVPVPVVFSNNKVKAETDMKLVVEDSKIQFTTFRGRRIEADLAGL